MKKEAREIGVGDRLQIGGSFWTVTVVWCLPGSATHFWLRPSGGGDLLSLDCDPDVVFEVVPADADAGLDHRRFGHGLSTTKGLATVAQMEAGRA